MTTYKNVKGYIRNLCILLLPFNRIVGLGMGNVSALPSTWNKSRPVMIDERSDCSPSFRDIVDIPTDILCNIFRFCSLQTDPIPNPKTAPLILAQICSHWRKVVTSFPEFWSKIWVRIICDKPFDSIPTRGLSQLNLATLWMNRANGYQLSISLVTKCVDEASQNLLYEEICRVILPIISTVRTLHIDSLPHTPFGQTPACRFHVASQLYDLHLCTARLLYPIQSFGSLPCLRRAAINVFHDDPTLISLPWASLTDLDIGGTGVETERCRNILRQCNSLKAGKFLIRTRRPIYPPKGPKVTLPLLERFIVFFDGQYDTSFFLDIELPSLSLFHIGTELAEIEWLTNSPLSMDYNGLQSLTLARVDISLDNLLCILHSASSIQHLALNFYRTNAEKFLRTLQYEDNSASTFLPQLRSLVLYTEHLALSEKSYVDAILSRWHVPNDTRIARLQKVTLLFLDFGWIESSLRSHFVQSQSEGLDITIEESFMGFIFPPYAAWDSFSPKPTS